MQRFVRANQLVLWFLFRFYLIVTRSHYRTLFKKSDVTHGTAYVIASNHQRRIDPFVIGAAMPLGVNRRFSPIWFMAYREFFKKWYMKWPLIAWGSYPHKEIGRLPYGLPYSEQVLDNKGTICIFPEGQRSLPGTVKAKRGVSILAQHTETKLVPVHLQWHKKTIGMRVDIVIGKPVDAPKLTPTQIMDMIYSM